MSAFPGSPRLLKAGLVLLDPATGQLLRGGVIVLPYNPDSLSRTLQIQAHGSGGNDGDRSEALRLRAPPVETIKLEAELDATDALERPVANPDAVQVGILPQLAALEALAYPPAERLRANDLLQRSGTLEIIPVEQPLTLFVWSRSRIAPVRLTELSITEEAFAPSLHPLRAKVSLGLRVLTVDDVGFDHKGGSLFMAYLRAKEQLAARAAGGGLAALGLSGVP